MHKIGCVLLVIGGLNWGLIGIGMLMGSDFNVVHMILGSVPTLEAVVYILVGVAAIMKIFGCRCKKCMVAGAGPEAGSMENKM
jgi:uncharacterized membrane protein YuzA (DUF378 family)